VSAAGRLPEIELAPGCRVIADLHLDPERRDSWQAFERFLSELASAAPPALLVLGDLFETWIGAGQAREPETAALLDALAARVRAGTALHVVHGNRDFLLGREFERASGGRVHPLGVVGRLASGRRVLCVHGDEFATRDRSYQRLRRTLRSRPVRWLANALPYSWKRSAARGLRRRSKSAVAEKPAATLQLQPDAALAWAARHGAAFVLAGHAHRFRDEALAGGVRWIVLDAFGGERDLVVAAHDGLECLGTRARPGLA